jgi:hypothetical protein
MIKSDGSAAMLVRGDGKVGIGTLSPSEEFHVLGRGIFDGGSGNSSTDAVLYVTKSNNNDWGLYVNAAALDYGMYARVSSSAGYAIAVNNGTTWTTRITGDGRIYLTEKDTIASYDTWLRLNESGHYGSGVFTPGVMRADGGFNVSGSTVWHAGNDGSGSGLDADTVDGVQASSLLRSDIYNSNYGGLQVFRNIGTIDGSWEDSSHTFSLENGDAGNIVLNFHRAGYTSNNLWYNGSKFRFDAALESTGVITATGGNSTNWNTAYGWGNHASAGYLPLTGGTLSGAVIVNLGNVSSDTVAFKVGGPANYDSLTIGMEDTPDYDAYIASFGNDIRFYSGKNVETEDHRFYWFTSKAGTSQHSQIAMQLDHNQALSVTGIIYASGGNSTNWNTAYSWGNHASASYATTSYVTTQINNLINGAPGALDTLDELAAALGDDSNFATTVTNSIAGKVSKAGDTMTSSGQQVLNIFHGAATGDFNDALFVKNTVSAQQVQIGMATTGSDGDHHRVSLRAYKGAQALEGVFGIALRQPGSAAHTQRLTLDYLGNLTIGGFLTESSSLKLKENVKTSEGNLEKVVNLRPVTYNKIGSQTTELGLIAEEVAEVYPEFVQYDENGEPVGVNYSRLTAALIGAVKELTNQVQELNKKING